MGWGDEGEGDGGNSFELDDDVAVLLDALDDAFDASEVTIDDDDTATHFVCDGSVVEKENAVVGEGSYTDKILHLTVGDVYDFGTGGRVERPGHHVTERTEIFIGHLEVGESLPCGMNEEEVVDGGDEFELAVSVALNEFVGDGKECFNTLPFQVFLHLQFAIVGDAHRIPKGLGAEVSHES